jgi:hypothetical protein
MNDTKMTQANGKVWPQTIDEAVARLLELMKPEDVEQIRQMEKGELVSLHFSLGMFIRNNFGLWNENKALGASADSASMKIIEALWERLQDDDVI